MKKLFIFFPKAFAFLGLISYTSGFNLYAQLNFRSYNSFDSLFSRIGSFHNDHLSNIYLAFDTSGQTDGYVHAIDQIKNANKTYFLANVSSYFESPGEENVDSAFNVYKFFVNNNNFMNRLMSSNDSFSLDKSLETSDYFDDLNAENKELLANISSLIKKNVNREITNEDFEDSLVVLANQWLDINTGKYYEIGPQLTGTILTIGLKSCEWWGENSEAMYQDDFSFIFNYSEPFVQSGPSVPKSDNLYLVPVVATDIAGAFIGTIASTASQLIVHGSINMNMVYMGAGAGAVLGSTGIIGKVGKWLSKWF
jgi:hypothetical protein